MPREREGFGEQLARLDEATAFVGLYGGTLLGDKSFPVKKGGKSRKPHGRIDMAPKGALARWMTPAQGGLR